jgi:predicted nucleotidyltransferase
VQLVFLFGSAADPSVPSPRDLDLAVLTEPPLPLDELLRLRADLVAQISAPLDLVSLNDAPPTLAREIVDGGRCLYARDPDDEVAFVTRTRARFWDFRHYRNEQWRLAGERLQERLSGTQA